MYNNIETEFSDFFNKSDFLREERTNNEKKNCTLVKLVNGSDEQIINLTDRPFRGYRYPRPFLQTKEAALFLNNTI